MTGMGGTSHVSAVAAGPLYAFVALTHACRKLSVETVRLQEEEITMVPPPQKKTITSISVYFLSVFSLFFYSLSLFSLIFNYPRNA